MKGKVPAFEDWLKMSEEDRFKTHLEWNVYEGEGEDIATEVFDRFCDEYQDVPRLTIESVGIYAGGTWAIQVDHPFIFDHRKYRLPGTYLGIEIKNNMREESLPPEFYVSDHDNEYIWAPERFEAFVDRCSDDIHRELGDPSMTRDDMLDALCPTGDFKGWCTQCRQWEKEGIIPTYQQITQKGLFDKKANI